MNGIALLSGLFIAAVAVLVSSNRIATADSLAIGALTALVALLGVVCLVRSRVPGALDSYGLPAQLPDGVAVTHPRFVRAIRVLNVLAFGAFGFVASGASLGIFLRWCLTC